MKLDLETKNQQKSTPNTSIKFKNILFLNKFIFIAEFVDDGVIFVEREKEIRRIIGKNEKIKRKNEINKIGKYLE